MQTFSCACGSLIFFENSQCLSCGRELGFIPESRTLSALESAADNTYRALADKGIYRKCGNYSQYNVCNWMVAEQEEQVFCVSCRLNRMIPDLSDAQNLRLWHRIEYAKRRLIYSCLALGLPFHNGTEGLTFQFLADDASGNEFSDNEFESHQIVTGHNHGLITINIREAEASIREHVRESLNERYRTLLGHFRHESGHYFWTRLVQDNEVLPQVRALFGDETSEYQQALARYYQEGPAPDWQNHYISAYASAHPVEDWAETWAHYLHMMDTVDTAHAYGFQTIIPVTTNLTSSSGEGTRPNFDDLFNEWGALSTALNALNRSMGLEDAYPFIISAPVAAKLRLIHEIVLSAKDKY